MKWRTALIIAKKDLRDALGNYLILSCLLLPVALSLLFRFAFDPNVTAGVITVAIHDEGKSVMVARIAGEDRMSVRAVSTAEAARELVRKKGIAGALLIPADFDADIAAGRRPALTVLYRRRKDFVAGLVERHLRLLARGALPARVTYRDVADKILADNARSASVFMRGLLILLLTMALGMTGPILVPLLITEEKEKQTLKALLVTPAGPAEVVAGKAVTGLVYCLVCVAAILLLNKGWTGDWPVTLLALFLGALFVVAVGLLMGAYFRSTIQANTWSGLALLVLLLPSWLSGGSAPAWIRALIRLIPTHYLVTVLRLSVIGQATWSRVALPLVVLAVSALFTFVLVVGLVRRRGCGRT